MTAPHLDRRALLGGAATGLAGMALGSLEQAGGAAGRPPHPPRARAVIQLFMSGAASQCDLYDYKPLLIERHGESWDPGEEVELFQSTPGKVMASPWSWTRHGECGKWMSSLAPCLAERVDDLAFVHSMVSKTNVHGPATFLQASGFVRPGFPSMGAWVSYGLGSLNDNLPTFVALPDSRGYAPNGPKNWSAGFLPAVHQGTSIRPGAAEPLADLFPPAGARISPREDRDAHALLNELNSAHARERDGDTRLAARIRAYELAARMQLSAPEALDLSDETEATRELYGVGDERTHDFAQRCLVARRLIERGVRFVQVWSGADNGFPRRNWDSHEDLARDHQDMGSEMDRPAAALLTDLKSRGLLDEVIVLWTTEFGRMPCGQSEKGRDHNPFGFTSWLAGGGIKGGVSYGATDEWSYRAIDKATQVYDIHATMLHLLGIDHERLTVRHDGIDRRLTDVHGHVIEELLA